MKLYVCKLQIQIYFITDFLQLHLIYVRNINLKITKKQQKYDHENRLHKPVTMPHLVTEQCPKTFFFTLLLTFGSRNPLLLIPWSVPSTLQKAYWTVTSHCTKTDQCCLNRSTANWAVSGHSNRGWKRAAGPLWNSWSSGSGGCCLDDSDEAGWWWGSWRWWCGCELNDGWLPSCICTHTWSAPSNTMDCVTDRYADGRRAQSVMSSAGGVDGLLLASCPFPVQLGNPRLLI